MSTGILAFGVPIQNFSCLFGIRVPKQSPFGRDHFQKQETAGVYCSFKGESFVDRINLNGLCQEVQSFKQVALGRCKGNAHAWGMEIPNLFQKEDAICFMTRM